MEWEEIIGKILVGGFGQDVIRGLISRYLEMIPAGKCQEYISQNKDLLGPVSETQWAVLRKAARAGKIDLSYSEVIQALSDNRPDLLGRIACTDGGVDWLKRQIETAKKKLA